MKSDKQQILEILSSLPNKQGTIKDIIPHLKQQGRETRSTLIRSLVNTFHAFATEGLIEAIDKHYSKEKRVQINIYRLTPKGEIHLLFQDSLLPVELKYPYVLVNETILPSLKAWQEMDWITPVTSIEILNRARMVDPLPLMFLLKSLYALDVLDLDFNNCSNLFVTVTDIHDKESFFTELITALTSLKKILETKRKY